MTLNDYISIINQRFQVGNATTQTEQLMQAVDNVMDVSDTKHAN